MRLLLTLALGLAPIPAIASDNSPVSAADLTAPAELVRAVDAAIAELTTPGGPAVKDWDKQGIDLIARLAAAPGGINATVTANEAAGDRSVGYYGQGRVEAPAGLTLLISLPGRAMPGDIAGQDVSELGEGLWMRTTARMTRRGNALCAQGWETMAILTPANVPLSEDAKIGVMVMRLMAQKLGDMEVCMIAFEMPDGTLHERSFLPDGRPLPKMDEQMKPVRLRPLADAAAILTR